MRLDHEETNGEVNAHIAERLRHGPTRRDSTAANDWIPVGRPARVNNDIREYYELAKKPVSGGAWVNKPEIPDPSEILRTSAPSNKDQALINFDDANVLHPHKPTGAYSSNEEYLGTTYELLREDALRPLREVVEEVRNSPFKDEAEYTNNSIGIYDPVYITSLVFSHRGLATRVAFSMGRVKKHIR